MSLNTQYWTRGSITTNSCFKYSNVPVHSNPSVLFNQNIDTSIATSWYNDKIIKLKFGAKNPVNTQRPFTIHVEDCTKYNIWCDMSGIKSNYFTEYKSTENTAVFNRGRYDGGCNPVLEYDYDNTDGRNLGHRVFLFYDGTWHNPLVIDAINDTSIPADAYGCIGTRVKARAFCYANIIESATMGVVVPYSSEDYSDSSEQNTFSTFTYNDTVYGIFNHGDIYNPITYLGTGVCAHFDFSGAIPDYNMYTGLNNWNMNINVTPEDNKEYSCYIPFDIPELNLFNGSTIETFGDIPDCLKTVGVYTNHVVVPCSAPYGHINAVDIFVKWNKLKEYCSKMGCFYWLDNGRTPWVCDVDSTGKCTGHVYEVGTAQANASSIATGKSSEKTLVPPTHDVVARDELDNIGLNLNANGASFVKYYACTSSALSQLLTWCNAQTQFNAIDWIIGVKQAPCDIPSISSTQAQEILLKGEHTSVNGYVLKNQGDSSTTSINSHVINRIHNNFLDYEPYTHIDLYVPFCGSVSLPPALFMGRTLKTEMIYDIFSGECSCAIFADNTLYTTIGGVFMTQQAVTAEQMGSIHNAVVNGAMSIIGGGVSTVAGAVAGNPIMAVGGALSMAGGAVKSYQTINSISPEVRGNSGGRCNFYKPDKYILMITTPNNITDSDFKKYNGLISNKTLTLSQNMGYTVINNPVITGNMTQQERQEIESYMKSGIIL